MKSYLAFILAAPLLAAACVTMGPPPLEAQMHLATAAGEGAGAGEIVVTQGREGVLLRVRMHGLPPGDHGIHVHANGSCDPGGPATAVVAAGAAGGHFDPEATGHHEGPMGHGHLGDLPLLHVPASGDVDVTLPAQRIHDVAALSGHAIIVHANGDNFSDTPAPLGGGGARIACGVLRQ